MKEVARCRHSATCWLFAYLQAGLLLSCRAGEADWSPLVLLGTRTSYNAVRGPGTTVEDVPGCRTEQVYSLLRHGTRHPGDDEVQGMESLLPAVQKEMRRNADRLNTDAHIPQLLNWTMKLERRHLGIADKGLDELHRIGERLRRRFPSLFSTISPEHVDLLCTDMDRSKTSSEMLLQGLFGKKWVGSPFSSSPHSSVPQSEDRLLLFSDLCQKYIQARLRTDYQGRQQLIRFDAGQKSNRLVQLVAQHLDIPSSSLDYEKVRMMYEACRYEFAILGETTWCSAFPREALELLEFRSDLKYYWRYGHGQSINYQPACLLLSDILQHFRDKADRKSTKRAVMRIAHSRTLLPLLARMGLLNDTLPLLADSFNTKQQRAWRLSDVNPFAANLALVLYECQDNYFVRTFLNEREIQLPGCDSMFCPLEDMTHMWRDLERSCDFDAICEHGLRPHIHLKDVTETLHSLDIG